jgi:SHS2 domain-containing protein
MKKTTNKTRTTKTTYVPVSNNVYHDGSSYRVRVSINGEKISKNFSNKKKAITFRNLLMKSA